MHSYDADSLTLQFQTPVTFKTSIKTSSWGMAIPRSRQTVWFQSHLVFACFSVFESLARTISIEWSTVDPRYNDTVCYQRFGCKIEFAVIKKLNMDPSEA